MKKKWKVTWMDGSFIKSRIFWDEFSNLWNAMKNSHLNSQGLTIMEEFNVLRLEFIADAHPDETEDNTVD